VSRRNLASGAELDRLEKFRRFARAQPRFESPCIVFVKIKAKIPGTKMAFAGIKNETEAQNRWAYISSFDKDGKQKR